MITTTINVNEDNKKIVKTLGINLSKYINEKLNEDFFNEKFILLKIKKLEEEIDNYKKVIGIIKNEKEKFNIEEMIYLKDSKVVFERHGLSFNYFFKRFETFVRKFKKNHLSFDDFKEIINKIKNE